jgi:hypothetical protein
MIPTAQGHYEPGSAENLAAPEHQVVGRALLLCVLLPQHFTNGRNHCEWAADV